jgi:hypothetical protein
MSTVGRKVFCAVRAKVLKAGKVEGLVICETVAGQQGREHGS